MIKTFTKAKDTPRKFKLLIVVAQEIFMFPFDARIFDSEKYQSLGYICYIT